ncbi:MAG TPA: NAD(+)/NADH kinase, partial [Solirubrobacterales bacterium]|nr:NAD(+)/NADH kinase [Solirubrobacterales bacterium]
MSAEGAGDRVAALISHSHPPFPTDAVRLVAGAAADAGWRLVASTQEVEKHGEAAAGIEAVDRLPHQADLCVVLGGDGSILYALRHFAGHGVPVFGVNFGTVGFLAAVERDEAGEGVRRAFEGETESIDLPGLQV